MLIAFKDAAFGDVFLINGDVFMKTWSAHKPINDMVPITNLTKGSTEWVYPNDKLDRRSRISIRYNEAGGVYIEDRRSEITAKGEEV